MHRKNTDKTYIMSNHLRLIYPSKFLENVRQKITTIGKNSKYIKIAVYP